MLQCFCCYGNLNLPVVYANDRFTAAILLLFLLCVCGFEGFITGLFMLSLALFFFLVICLFVVVVFLFFFVFFLGGMVEVGGSVLLEL